MSRKGVKGLREIAMLEWICHWRPTHHTGRVPKTYLSPLLMRNKVVSGGPASLKSSVMALFCRPDLTVGTELRNQNTTGVIESWIGGAKWWPSTTKGKVDMVTKMDSRVKATVTTMWNCIELWHWLVDYGVPKNEIDRKPTEFLLHLYEQKS